MTAIRRTNYIPPRAPSWRRVQRSDSTDFYKKCLAAGLGASVELEIWPRMWHCFQQYAEGCGAAEGDTTETAPQPLMEAV
eukprot:SAG11_NODE_33023_length_279_cov_1.144444_1_plen_79_part_01